MKTASSALIVMTALLPGCTGQKAADHKANEARKAAVNTAAIVAALASRHDADDQWENPLKGTDRFGFYTFELQRALIRPDRKPVILVGPLEDVISLGANNYEIRGRQSLEAGYTLHFSLTCGSERLGNVLGRPPGLMELVADFAVVATISNITKPMFKAAAEISTDDEIQHPQIAIEAADVLVATGKCLEVVRLDGEESPQRRPTRP